MSKVVLFNKPFKVLSQFTTTEQKKTLSDFFNNDDLKGCYPAGRLDYDSEGLLLLTDDGKLQHRITDPSKKLPKHYWVQVEGEINDEDLAPIRHGLDLKSYRCKPAHARVIRDPVIWARTPPIRTRIHQPTSWIEIILTEGKNRQVRKMCSSINFPCLRLVRYKIGPWTLENLKPGEFRLEHVHLPEHGMGNKKRNRGSSIRSGKS